MYLYNLTLQRPTAVYQSISGNFSGTKQIEIVLNHGRSLELIKYDEDGKMQSILYTEVFGIIRSIIPFRLTSGTKDYIIVGSDSGRVVILEFNQQKNQFDKVHQETFGRSGCRRIVPGQYLAVDPKGRAFMIGAIEKQKLVYILNRDSSANLTISSPLEAHKSNTIVFSMCGVDVGFDNPIFATISVDYTEEESNGNDESVEDMMDETIGKKKKLLTFYELDLGLNNVVRKWSDQIDDSSNIVMTVPGGTEGPGGVLVTCEDYIVYRNQEHPEIRAKIPRRYGTDPNKGLLIVSHSSHKQKGMFFFLVQSEHGDLYKITLDYQGEQVSRVNVNYFDTIPLANCLTVLKNGFLFSASEFGDHSLYFFKSLGDEEEEGQAERFENKDGFIWFNPRITAPSTTNTGTNCLKNLEPTSTLSSLSPIIDFKVLDLVREENPQLYSLCGVGNNSSLKVLRHGLSVTTITTANLPGIPSGIWTVPKSTSPNSPDQTDKYIVVSFVGTTSVLSVGETIQENHESGILETATTLLVKSIGDDAMVQVFPTGFRHIKSDMRINEWRAPGRKTIVCASANQSQLVIALSGGELIYFELDQAGNLIEIIKKDLRRDIACIEISPIPKGRSLARFLVITDWEGPIRMLSLDRDNCLGQVSMLDTDKVYIESLSIVEMQVNEMGIESSIHHSKKHQAANTSSSLSGGSGTLFLFVGLKNGVVKRATLDSITGELSDIRTRLLGRKPVKLFKVKVRGSNAVLALSSRAWLNYVNQGKLDIIPLSIEPLENASNLSSEQSAESIVATSENKIIIFSVDRLGDLFNQQIIPLDATPKRFIIHPQTSFIILLETETNYTTESLDVDKINQDAEKLQQEKQKEIQQEMDIADEDDQEDGSNTANIEPFKPIFKPKAGKGLWKSYIKIMDPISHEVLENLVLDQGEAGFSVCTCSFGDSGEIFLAVGCATGVILNPKSCKSASINIYRFVDGGKKLELVYKTEVEEPVYAMAAFQGRLVCGVGKCIRIYDMGKKKLLRKCETKNLPNTIVNIHSLGDRLVVGDIQESIHFIKYKRSENMLYVFADDLAPRWMTASVMLDYDTVAGSDKFGNIFILRLPLSVSDEVEEDPTGSKLKFETGTLNGAPHKLEHIANFFVGDTVTTLNKASLVVGGPESIIYTTISGAIGALIPFSSREDVDFFSTLEMNMRNDCLPLCGRDHLAYRSYYFPVKNVIDGDLCEQFSSLLDIQKQRSIAEELSRSPSEVIKKLEDVRSQKLL